MGHGYHYMYGKLRMSADVLIVILKQFNQQTCEKYRFHDMNDMITYFFFNV